MTQKEIETRLLNLERAFLQAQKNAVDVTEKADKTVSQENEINMLAETSTDIVSKVEKTDAQALFTALMTDTLIEEEVE